MASQSTGIRSLVTANVVQVVDPSTSSGLTLGITGGIAQVAGVWTVREATTETMTDGAVNYVERTAAGVVSTNQTAFTGSSIPIAQVTTFDGVMTEVLAYAPADATPLLDNIPAIDTPTGDAETTINALLLDLKAKGLMVDDA